MLVTNISLEDFLGGPVVKNLPARRVDKKVVVHIHNGILLSYWKKSIWISFNEIDETGAYYTEWSKSEKHQYSISSVQFSRSVVSDSLWPHESQHTRPPCPSPTPGIHSNSCPFSRWCHPAISSSVEPFFSCPQPLPASESFPMSQLFPWGGQSTGVSALASFLPKKSQGWSPSEWTGWMPHH